MGSSSHVLSFDFFPRSGFGDTEAHSYSFLPTWLPYHMTYDNIIIIKTFYMSEPAFLSTSTMALPPSTCTARREAGQLGQLAVVSRGLCRAENPPAVSACSGMFCRLCLPAVSPLPCHAHCPSHQFAPRSFCFAPGSFHVRQLVCTRNWENSRRGL